MRLSPQNLPLKVHWGIFTSVALFTTILFGGILVSGAPSSVHAEETEVRVNVPISIAISASPTTVDIGALAPEAFGTDYTDLTVSTNSAGGYLLNIASSSSTSASLVHTKGAATGHIDSITAPVTINATGSNFPGDKWGYSIGAGSASSSKDYQIVPLSGSAAEIASKDTPVMDDVTRVNFGTRPTSSMASGTYTGSVIFSAIAKDPPTKDITKLTSMQDLANHPEYCANTAEGVSTTIPDTRDNQTYTIFKAKDGNCWMGENLRFGINPDGTAHPFTSADVAGSDPNLNSTKMLDLTYDSSNPNTAGRIKNGSSGMKANNGSDNAFSSAGDNYTEPYINIYQANQAADYDGQTKYGVQYNYCAVTGGTACTDSSTDYNPTGSICPKGWKLPGMTADPTGSGTSTGEKSYNDLFNAYGVTADSAGFNKITPSPLSFVRAGGAGNGSLYYRSSSGRGFYWSSTKYSGAYGAYSLRFSSSLVYQNDDGRYYGYSARCVSE